MKIKMLVAGAAVLLSTAFSSTAALAWPPGGGSGWELLGTRTVTDRMDRDEIFLPGHAKYRQVRICVSRNPIRVFDIDVYYQNGTHQDISVRNFIRDGECTRSVDLDNGRRDIRTIRMVYGDTAWGHGRTAVVRVYGRRW